MKKFSIIVPSHNGQEYISKCLNSIRQQTYSDYEIIFINDSSTDYTADIIHSDFNFPNIKYYEVSFEDISKVRNYGLSKVSGDAIIFVDVDDWIEKSLLEKLSIIDNENDMIRYQGIMVDNDSKVYEEYITDEFYISKDEFLNSRIYTKTFASSELKNRTFTISSSSNGVFAIYAFASKITLSNNDTQWNTYGESVVSKNLISF